MGTNIARKGVEIIEVQSFACGQQVFKPSYSGPFTSSYLMKLQSFYELGIGLWTTTNIVVRGIQLLVSLFRMSHLEERQVAGLLFFILAASIKQVLIS